MAESMRYSIHFRIALLLMLTFYPAFETRAERLPVRTYTTADGLAHNRVKRIVQDSRGFLWLCTAYGLSRFDGSRFNNYGLEDGLSFASINDFLQTRDGACWIATNGGGVCRFNPHVGLPIPITDQTTPLSRSQFISYTIGDSPQAIRVNKLYEDRAGRIWAGTDGGLFYLDRTEAGDLFHRADLGVPSRPDGSVQVWDFAEDREGALWIGTSFGLLQRSPQGKMLHYPVSPTHDRDLVWALISGREGKIWMGHEGGLFEFMPPHFGSSTHRYTTADGLGSNDVRSICEARDGRLWIGTNEGGLAVFDGRNFRTYTTAQGLNAGAIISLAEDRTGNLWAGTGNGIMKLPQSGFTTYTATDGLGHDTTSYIFETDAGEFYAITGERRINRLDGSRFTAVRPNLPEQVSDSSWRVYQGMLRDHLGEWWIATPAGLCRFPNVTGIEQLARVRPKAFYTTRDGLAGNSIAQLFEDSRGDIWISTFIPGREALTRWERSTGKFHRYSDADGLPTFNSAVAFGTDVSGNLWVGFREGGLARFTGGRFSLFGTAEGLPSYGEISCIYSDKAGRLWIATQLDGLRRIDNPQADRPRLVAYKVADGLESDYTSQITEDREGRLYIGTAHGIDRLDPATGQIKHYTTADGLADDGVLTAFCDRQGALWFGTSRGVSRLIPQPDHAQLPPTTFISGLRVAGVAYTISELGEAFVARMEFEANQNQIEIDFLGLSFKPGEPIRYSYKMEAIDHEWRPLTDQRTVNYVSLAPGKYRFLVEARSASGEMSLEPATFDFHIRSPIWQRWWFVTIAATLIAAILFAFERYRAGRVKVIKESEARFRTLAETASDAIITIDEHSTIIFVNPAAENIFGYTIAEMMGHNLTKLMPEYLRHLHKAGFSKYIETGQRHLSWEAIELPGLHKDGREIPLEISFGEFTRNDRHFFTGVARDITERKRAEEALSRSREERLIEIEQVRKRIATDLHDDIGSSLTQISILSEVARRELARDEVSQKEPLSMIASASRELIDSMSDIVWAINPQKDHLSDLVKRMRLFASDIFTARNIKFRFSAPGPDQDIRMGANIRREVFLIFKESVNNLVRHSACTEADIEFRVEDDRLWLRVSDNGRGFDPSQQSEGHGLASMRERARHMGGDFDIQSDDGQGTTVYLRLPLQT